MDVQAELYKKITNAGKFSFWLGVVQLVLSPLAVFIEYSNPDSSNAVKLLASIIDVLFTGTLGALLIIYGRRLKATTPAEPASLRRAAHARKVVNITVITGIVLTVLSGGRAGLLLLLLILSLRWANQSIKLLLAQQSAAAQPVTPPPTPAPPATASEPVVTEPPATPPTA